MEIQSKMVEIISIFTLNFLKLLQIQIHISRRGPVNLSTETFPNINLTQPKWNFFFAWKINPKMAAKIFIYTCRSFKGTRNQTHI